MATNLESFHQHFCMPQSLSFCLNLEGVRYRTKTFLKMILQSTTFWWQWYKLPTPHYFHTACAVLVKWKCVNNLWKLGKSTCILLEWCFKKLEPKDKAIFASTFHRHQKSSQPLWCCNGAYCRLTKPLHLFALPCIGFNCLQLLDGYKITDLLNQRRTTGKK